ncbi:MAG: hypothetical protein OXI01_24180 [Albidovulum sp.]|nr:hypothetical protein [Albidovulum sp.]
MYEVERKIIKLEHEMDTREAKYDSALERFRADMSGFRTDMAGFKTHMAERDKSNTRWYVGLASACVFIISSLVGVIIYILNTIAVGS